MITVVPGIKSQRSTSSDLESKAKNATHVLDINRSSAHKVNFLLQLY